MSVEKFKNEIEKHKEKVEGNKKDSFFTVFMRFMAKYGVFVLIPFIVIAIIYMIKIGKLQVKERKK